MVDEKLLIPIIFSTLFFILILFFRILKIHDLKKLSKSTPLGHFVQIDEFNIFFQQMGEGPDILLIHGIGANHYPWRYLAPLLAPNFRVTIIDLPGFGMSSKIIKKSYSLEAQGQRIEKFCQLLNLKDVTLVGSSMGGAISLFSSARNPQLFPRVIALSPAIHPRWEVWLTYLVQPLSLFIFPLMNTFVVRALYSGVVSQKENLNQEALLNYGRPYLLDPAAIDCFLGAAQEIFGPKVNWEFLNQMDSQVLIIHGMKDKLISTSSMKKAQKSIPKSLLTLHPQAGHHSMEDFPHYIAKEIETFFHKTI